MKKTKKSFYETRVLLIVQCAMKVCYVFVLIAE